MNEEQKRAIARARQRLEEIRAATAHIDPASVAALAIQNGRYDAALVHLLRDLGEDVPLLHELHRGQS